MSTQLHDEAAQLFEVVDKLAEVSDEAKVLRKEKKGLEDALLQNMLREEINEIEIGGRRITLSTNLKLEK
jgi:hypothetical protein